MSRFWKISLAGCVSDPPYLDTLSLPRCSKMVLKNWLTAVFTTEPDDERTMAFNRFNQSRDFDIRVSQAATAGDIG